MIPNASKLIAITTVSTLTVRAVCRLASAIVAPFALLMFPGVIDFIHPTSHWQSTVLPLIVRLFV